MTKLKLNNTQLDYMYYIFSCYCYPNIEISDPLYQLFSQDICLKLVRIKKHKPLIKTLKLNRLETAMFYDIVAVFYLGIEHDKRLVWERLFLIQLADKTRQTK